MNRVIKLIFFFFGYAISLYAQEIKLPNICKPQLDSMLKDVKVDDALKWAEQKPIRVGCDDGKVYVLNHFEVSFFIMNPMQTKEFGIGDSTGLPLLAQNMLKRVKPGDTVILKNVTYIDDKAVEQKLPVISFRLY